MFALQVGRLRRKEIHQLAKSPSQVFSQDLGFLLSFTPGGEAEGSCKKEVCKVLAELNVGC